MVFYIGVECLTFNSVMVGTPMIDRSHRWRNASHLVFLLILGKAKIIGNDMR